MARVRSELRDLIRASLLDAECSSAQSAEAIQKLAQRLDAAQSMEQHWPLIFDLYGKRATSIFQLFAHYVSASWITKGARYEWQMFPSLPRNVSATPVEQRKAHKAIEKAAQALDRAMRSPAAHPGLCGTLLGHTHATHADTFGQPVVAIPLAAKNSESDSILRRLIDAAKSNPIEYIDGLLGRAKDSNARETYFTRRMAQVLLYDSKKTLRPRIERFIADLIVELGNWEGAELSWDAERVRQCLKIPSVRSKKISS